MEYYYKKTFAHHWEMIISFVEENYSSPEHDNDVLVMHANMLDEEFPRPAGKIIVYQLEPLVLNQPKSANWWDPIEVIEQLKQADEVWDYDLDNIKILKEHGIDAKYRPLRYTNSLKRIPNDVEKDIDILFFGSQSEYRSKFLKDFTQGYIHSGNDELSQVYLNLNLVHVYNMFDSKLDEFIARSKIILNLNPFSVEGRQQQTRIFYSLINEKCIMSEVSNRNYFGDCIIQFKGSQDFGDKVIKLIHLGDWQKYPTQSYDWDNFVNRRDII